MFLKYMRWLILVGAVFAVCSTGSVWAKDPTGSTAADRSGLQPAGELINYFLYPSQINFVALVDTNPDPGQ